MTHCRAQLIGTGWSGDLCAIVLAHEHTTDAPAEVCGLPASRALFFAEVMKLDRAETRDANGTLWCIKADTSLDHDIMLRAASEIMGYFGRVAPGVLAPRRAMILSRAASATLAGRGGTPANLRSTCKLDQVETMRATATHEGFFLTRTYALRHPRFNGSTSEILTREVFVATDAALVLPYDPVRDRLLLIEQFRMGPFGRGDPLPWVLEPVAGRIDAGETPEDTARRECLEEADLELGHLEHINTHYCSPGCSTEVFHCFVGLCDLPDQGHSHGGLETEHEDLRRHVLNFDDAMALTRSGEVNIGPLFAMLLWLERERPRLRASA